MSTETTQYTEKLLKDGTKQAVTFNGTRVGFAGRTKDSDTTLFVWFQTPLKFMSTQRKTAYSMSTPILTELESIGVDEIFIPDAEVQVPISEVQNGDVLEPDDPRFNEPQKYKQFVVYTINKQVTF